MLTHPLTNFEIQKYYQNDAQLRSQNEPKYNNVYSINNLPIIKDGACIINLDGFKLIGAHWVDLYVNDNNAP